MEYCERFHLDPSTTEVSDEMLLYSKAYFIYSSQVKGGFFEHEHISPTAVEQVEYTSLTRLGQILSSLVDTKKNKIEDILSKKEVRQRLQLDPPKHFDNEKAKALGNKLVLKPVTPTDRKTEKQRQLELELLQADNINF